MREQAYTIFDGHTPSIALFETLLSRIQADHPALTVKYRKDQVVLAAKRNFATIWPSTQRVEPAITLTLALHRHIVHPRIPIVKEVTDDQFNHHIVLSDASEIDDLLMEWFSLAYQFGSR